MEFLRADALSIWQSLVPRGQNALGASFRWNAVVTVHVPATGARVSTNPCPTHVGGKRYVDLCHRAPDLGRHHSLPVRSGVPALQSLGSLELRRPFDAPLKTAHGEFGSRPGYRFSTLRRAPPAMSCLDSRVLPRRRSRERSSLWSFPSQPSTRRRPRSMMHC